MNLMRVMFVIIVASSCITCVSVNAERRLVHKLQDGNRMTIAASGTARERRVKRDQRRPAQQGARREGVLRLFEDTP